MKKIYIIIQRKVGKEDEIKAVFSNGNLVKEYIRSGNIPNLEVETWILNGHRYDFEHAQKREYLIQKPTQNRGG